MITRWTIAFNGHFQVCSCDSTPIPQRQSNSFSLATAPKFFERHPFPIVNAVVAQHSTLYRTLERGIRVTGTAQAELRQERQGTRRTSGEGRLSPRLPQVPLGAAPAACDSTLIQGRGRACAAACTGARGGLHTLCILRFWQLWTQA